MRAKGLDRINFWFFFLQVARLSEMSKQSDSPEQDLVSALRESDLGALAGDLTEVGLDALLEDGLLKDVPVIGVIQKLYNIGACIRNRLFVKKLLKFLGNLSDIPLEQRQKQIDRLTADENERQLVGEQILLLLDRMSNMSKPVMMAQALKAYLREEIDRQALHQLWHVIDVIDVSTISELRRVYESDAVTSLPDVLPPTEELHHLVICGLLVFEFGGLVKPDNGTPQRGPGGTTISTIAKVQKGGFRRNSLGQLFVRVVL